MVAVQEYDEVVTLPLPPSSLSGDDPGSASQECDYAVLASDALTSQARALRECETDKALLDLEMFELKNQLNEADAEREALRAKLVLLQTAILSGGAAEDRCRPRAVAQTEGARRGHTGRAAAVLAAFIGAFCCAWITWRLLFAGRDSTALVRCDCPPVPPPPPPCLPCIPCIPCIPCPADPPPPPPPAPTSPWEDLVGLLRRIADVLTQGHAPAAAQ